MDEEYIPRKSALQAIYTSTAPALEVKAIPAADVAPVRYGRWEWDRLREAYRCSCCDNYNTDRTAFCPNCGAKMDGGQEDA